jgi:hypothetical protein
MRAAPKVGRSQMSSTELGGQQSCHAQTLAHSSTLSTPLTPHAQLAWDGAATGYEQRPFAADPCGAGAAADAAAAAAPTRLEAALGALTALLVAGGPPAAGALHGADFATTLRALGAFGARGPLEAAAAAAGAAAWGCRELREELLRECGGVTLSGMLRFQLPPSVQAGAQRRPAAGLADMRRAAAERLCAAVDGVPGWEFALLIGAGPQAGGGAGAAGAGAAPASDGWLASGCALGCAYAIVTGALEQPQQLERQEPALHDPRLLEACGQLVASALERTRRSCLGGGSGGSAGAIPRVGCWRGLDPREVAATEARVRQPGWWLRLGSSGGAQGGVGATPGAGQEQAPAGSSPQGAAAGSGAAGRSIKSAPPAAAARGAKGAEAAAAQEERDEDGLRVVWDSGPSEALRAARAAWRAVPLGELVSWQQSSGDLEVTFLLPPGEPPPPWASGCGAGWARHLPASSRTPLPASPCRRPLPSHPSPGTTKRDLAVLVRPDRLTVSLAWAGRVLDGPLTRGVRASEAVWTLADAPPAHLPPPPPLRPGAPAAGADATAAPAPRLRPPEGCVALSLVLPKAEEGRFWKSLFEGGAEKSHWEVRFRFGETEPILAGSLNAQA